MGIGRALVPYRSAAAGRNSIDNDLFLISSDGEHLYHYWHDGGREDLKVNPVLLSRDGGSWGLHRLEPYAELLWDVSGDTMQLILPVRNDQAGVGTGPPSLANSHFWLGFHPAYGWLGPVYTVQ